MRYAFKRPPGRNVPIRSARVPQQGHPLSGVVHVHDGANGFCYIRFDERLVERVGRGMPYGVGKDTPAYLYVVQQYDHYNVIGCYLDGSITVALWREDTMPKWVKRIQRKEVSVDETKTYAKS